MTKPNGCEMSLTLFCKEMTRLKALKVSARATIIPPKRDRRVSACRKRGHDARVSFQHASG